MYRSAVLILALSATLAASTPLAPPANVSALVFKADFSRSTIAQAFGVDRMGYGAQNAVLWASGGGVEAHYPAGSSSPDGSGPLGGFGVWTKHPVPTEGAKFRFDVWFPADFDFVHGGKLFGVYGGYGGCGGGAPAVTCFSARIMWRDNGDGELYWYADRDAQDQRICDMPGNYCDPKYGWALNQGSWRFQRGAWTTVEETVRLNTPGVQNGHLQIKINGVEVVRYDNLVFRNAQNANMRVEGMAIDTFFGGTSSYWATPRHQLTKFKEVILETA